MQNNKRGSADGDDVMMMCLYRLEGEFFLPIFRVSVKKIFSKTVRLAGSRHNYIVFFLLETRELAVYLLLGFLALFIAARALRSLRERERGSCLALVGIATWRVV